MSARDPVLEARAAEARERLAPIASEYPFQPRFLRQPGAGPGDAPVLQHYLDEGPREASAVLCVHGNPTWSFAWRRVLAAVRPHRRAVAVDHVGCGLSDRPLPYPYRLERHVENLERLVLALGLERVTLVLHDWGGPIGLGLARRHPERVERLILANTAAFPLDGRLPLRLEACRVPLFGALAIRGFNAFARAATWMAVARPLPPDVKRGYLLPYDSWRNRVATHAFVQDIPVRPGDPSWDELAAIEASLQRHREIPVHLFWGERDWVFTPRYRQEFERRFPHASVVTFEQAGHYVFEDEREAFAEEVARLVLAPERARAVRPEASPEARPS